MTLRSDVCAEDFAEVAVPVHRVGAVGRSDLGISQGRIGKVEHWCVRDVERLGPELQLHPLGEGEVLEEGEVEYARGRPGTRLSGNDFSPQLLESFG